MFNLRRKFVWPNEIITILSLWTLSLKLITFGGEISVTLSRKFIILSDIENCVLKLLKLRKKIQFLEN